MNTTSVSLLECVARGEDPSSWRRFYDVYSPLLRHWLRRFQVQDADAEDLIQEVLTVVCRELAKFEHNERKGAFRNWLKVILIHRVRDFWRAAKHRPLATGANSIQRELDELSDDSSRVSQIWDREHDEFVMNRLMDQVKPRFDDQTWHAFRLQSLSGRSAREVSDQLGMSINSVYLARSRVLNALRREADGLID